MLRRVLILTGALVALLGALIVVASAQGGSRTGVTFGRVSPSGLDFRGRADQMVTAESASTSSGNVLLSFTGGKVMIHADKMTTLGDDKTLALEGNVRVELDAK